VLQFLRRIRYNSRMTTDTRELSDELEMQIKEALAPLHPDKVILFGSHAWGQPTEDSDIDLYVVTQFVETDSSFARQIMKEGVRLL
jgi:predicted nucleotidyltransferase